MLRLTQRGLLQPWTRRLSPSLPSPTQLVVAPFHSCAPVWGRKSGSKTFELPARDPSKKQMRKRAKMLEALAEKRDPRKEKIRERNLARQVSSGKIGKKLEEMRGILQESMQTLLAPTPELQNLLLSAQSPEEEGEGESEVLDYQPESVISLLTERKRQASKETRTITDTSLLPPPQTESERAEREKERERKKAISSADADIDVSPDWANAALHQLLSHTQRSLTTSSSSGSGTRSSRGRRYAQAKQLFSLMNEQALPVQDSLYAPLVRAATQTRRFADADEIFDKALSNGVTPSRELWEAKICNVAASGQISQALSLLENVRKLGLATVHAYNAILGAYLEKRQFSEMNTFWLRCHSDGVPLTLSSFHTMLRAQAMQGEVERAFFLLDELQQAYGLQPDRDTFIALFDACGKSPYWVRGYEHSVEDAMLRMEGMEIKPDIHVYNAVISAYAHMGDAVRAEYYFWESRRKGLAPNAQTYIALLSACAKSQAVGASEYGWKGRIAPRAEEKWTRNQIAMKTLGAERTAQLLTSGISADVSVVKGKRVKSSLVDLLDDRSSHADVLSQIEDEAFGAHTPSPTDTHRDASSLTVTQGDGEDEEGEGEEWDWESEAEKDPALRSLMEEVEGDLSQDERETVSEEGEIDHDLILSHTHAHNAPTTHPHAPHTPQTHTDPVLGYTEKSAAQLERERQWLCVADALRDYETDSFADPFTAVQDRNGSLPTQLTGTESATAIAAGEEGEESTEEERRERLTQSLSLLQALDGTASSASSSLTRTEGETDEDASSLALSLRRELDSVWRAIEFGRVPALDNAHFLTRMPLSTRRKINKKRAELAMREALSTVPLGDVKERRQLWNAFLSVSAEAVHVDDALAIFSEMSSLSASLPPAQSLVDSRSFESLIRMYVRAKDLDKALQLKEEMKEKSLRPSSDSYGILVRAFTHRDMVVEALKTLEEAVEQNVKIHERNLTILRNRCTKLKVSHPALGPDPQAWVKEVKDVRRNRKESSRRVIQSLQSAAWH